MLKIILWIVIVFISLVIVYVALGYFGIVPLYHCDSSMGPNGVVKWCEWYAGPARVY